MFPIIDTQNAIFTCAMCGKSTNLPDSFSCCENEIISQIIENYHDSSLHSYHHIGACVDLVLNDSIEAANFSDSISNYDIKRKANELCIKVKMIIENK